MAKKILFVDDEPDMLKVATFRLKKAGYEVITAVNGGEALESVKNNMPGLIFLDLKIPVISGYEVAKILKADDKYKRIPIIIFTASVDRIADKMKETCADDYVLKPFEPDELAGKAKKYIGEA